MKATAVHLVALLAAAGVVRVAAAGTPAADGPPPACRTNHVWVPALPPAPEGVADFAISDLFRKPVGPRGLEYSEAARALEGKRVRIAGHMVRQTLPIPFAFLLSPVAQSLHEREYGLCDDLPGSTLHVFLPKGPQPVVPFRPGLVAVTGVLELGPHEEADGRQSVARLRVADRSPASFLAVTNFVPAVRIVPLESRPVDPPATPSRRQQANIFPNKPKDRQQP